MQQVGTALVAISLLFGFGCARSISQEAKAEIAKPVDCSTAELDYDDTIDQNFAIGVSRGRSKGASVGVFYRRGKQRTSSGSRTEDRYHLDLGWTKPVSLVEFSGRLRTELRTYRRNAKNDVLRFRFRVRLRSPKERGRNAADEALHLDRDLHWA